MTESKRKKVNWTEEVTEQYLSTKWDRSDTHIKRIKRGKHYRNITTFTPEIIVKLASEEFSYNSNNLDVKGKSVFHKRFIPLYKLIESSLKLNNIEQKDRKAVEKFAADMINEFFKTLQEMLLKKNYLYMFNDNKHCMFLSQQPRMAKMYNWDIVNKCAEWIAIYFVNIYKSQIREDGHFVSGWDYKGVQKMDENRPYQTKMCVVRTSKEYKKKIYDNMTENKRGYLPMEQYINEIKRNLPYKQRLLGIMEYLRIEEVKKRQKEEYKIRKQQENDTSLTR